MFLIKFFIYFCLSFVILCIPVSEKNIFFYLDEAARPVTNQIYSYISGKAAHGKDVSVRFLKEQTPRESLVDRIKSKYSSTKKDVHNHKHKDVHGLDYSKKDKQRLNDILMKALNQ